MEAPWIQQEQVDHERSPERAGGNWLVLELEPRIKFVERFSLGYLIRGQHFPCIFFINKNDVIAHGRAALMNLFERCRGDGGIPRSGTFTQDRIGDLSHHDC
jgi:hypothetical protein